MGIRRSNLGLAYAIGSMFTWGMVPVLGHLFTRSIDPLLFGGLTAVIGGLPFVAVLASRNRLRDLASPRFAPAFAGITILGVASTALLFYGTTLTSGVNTGLLLQIEPLYSVVIAALLLGEAVHAPALLATLFMMAGAAFVIYRGSEGLNRGDLLIAFTPCLQQLSHVITKKIILKVPDKNAIPAVRLLVAGIVLTGIAVSVHPDSVGQLAVPANWLALLLFGLVFRSLDFFLWYESLERIPLSRASATIPVSVAVSFAGSMLLLGEKILLRHLAGLALILTGLVWLSAIHLRGQDRVVSEEPVL
jgi:drug/metabolite transporter (DMT)-like permease